MYDQDMMFFGGMMVFLPWILFSIPLAFGNYFLAKRLDESPELWFILTIIPIINILFFYYLIYIILFFVIDHLKEAAAKSAEQ